MVKLEKHHLSYFLRKSFDGSENMFAYQPPFIMLGLKVNKSAEYVIDWKSKGLNKSKLLPLDGAFFSNILCLK